MPEKNRALETERPALPTTTTVTTSVEVVVPVYNEERALPGCIKVLHAYLEEFLPYDWTVTIVDNASTDRTAEVAGEIAVQFDRVSVLSLATKGRGHALKTAWGRSSADVVVYMDVDLSTGLDALLPLIAPLANGHSDIAIGSRLAPGSRTVRRLGRELVSRSYNRIIRLLHGARFSDAQCGFKAARRELVQPLLPNIRDDAWFFDTELLLLAEHNGLRIHEVPVDWVEDVDSRVHVGKTAMADLRGLARVAWAKTTGTATVNGLPRRPDPRSAHPDAVTGQQNPLPLQILTFALIGVLSTVAHALLYLLLRTMWPPLVANLVSLVITSILNTEANRRATFAHAARGSSTRIHLQGLIVFVMYYAVTSGALLLLRALVPDPSRALELVVLVVSAAIGTALRFIALRTWVFRSKSATTGGKLP